MSSLQKSLSKDVDECLETAIAEGVMPGAVLLASIGGLTVHFKAYGLAQKFPNPYPMSPETVFDLASMTKVLATTAAVMQLVSSGAMNINDPVARFIPEYVEGWQREITVYDLLTHGSGLPAWRPFYQDVLDAQIRGGPGPGTREARRAIMEWVRTTPQAQPRGEGAVYTDLGIILLTETIERISGCRLDHYCEENIYRPLGLKHVYYLPLGEGTGRRGLPATAFATTEFNPWLGRYLNGEVHDDNTHAMGGVSGHAGLFGAAEDVHHLALTLLRTYHGTERRIFDTDVVRTFWRKRVFPDGTTRACGWDVPTGEGSASGHLFSEPSVGHLGFTGTSVWIDISREIIVLLLTNRVHPSRNDDRIKSLRPQVHDRVMERLVARTQTF